MLNTKEKVQKDISLRKYSDLINRIAKVEYRSLKPQYLIEYDELINIGFQTVNILCGQNDFDAYNESYLSTAIKWAIRNELRNRYKWYALKHSNLDEQESDKNGEDGTDNAITPGKVREAVYETIL